MTAIINGAPVKKAVPGQLSSETGETVSARRSAAKAMRENYQRSLERELDAIACGGVIPRLLLHACCAPCSSYVLEYLSAYFHITLFYYNPNIAPKAEYDHRATELRRLVTEMPVPHPAELTVCDYDPAPFLEAARGFEQEPEGGARCERCFRLRLERAAQEAKAGGYEYFATTLSISPHKDAFLLNQIGREMGQKYGVTYLCSDFKKKGGYQRSIELCREYGIYRQTYCGCACGE